MTRLIIFLFSLSAVFAQSTIEWNFAGWSEGQLKYETDNKLATGRFHDAPEFTPNYVKVRNGNFFQADNAPREFLKTNELTIEIIIRLTDLAEDLAGVFGFGDTVTKQGLFLGYWGRPTQHMNVAFLGTTMLDIVQKKRPVATGEWVHLLATCGRNHAEFYINGQLMGRKSYNKHTIIYPDHNVLSIGAYYSPNNQKPFPVNADIHMAKLYNFALNETEIKRRIKWGQELIRSEFKIAKPILKSEEKKNDKKEYALKRTFEILALIFLVFGIFLTILSKIIASSQANNTENNSYS